MTLASVQRRPQGQAQPSGAPTRRAAGCTPTAAPPFQGTSPRRGAAACCPHYQQAGSVAQLQLKLQPKPEAKRRHGYAGQTGIEFASLAARLLAAGVCRMAWAIREPQERALQRPCKSCRSRYRLPLWGCWDTQASSTRAWQATCSARICQGAPSDMLQCHASHIRLAFQCLNADPCCLLSHGASNQPGHVLGAARTRNGHGCGLWPRMIPAGLV